MAFLGSAELASFARTMLTSLQIQNLQAFADLQRFELATHDSSRPEEPTHS